MIMAHRHHVRAEKEEEIYRNKYAGQNDQCNDWKKT